MRILIFALVCLIAGAFYFWPRAQPTASIAAVVDDAPRQAVPTQASAPPSTAFIEEHDNVTFGKVQSGTATLSEIETYFAQRQKMSEAAIAFSMRALEGADAMTEEQRGLYELSVRMHKTRLEEIPRRKAEAIARKEAQDTKRAEWKASQ